jgi:hypothetical protein
MTFNRPIWQPIAIALSGLNLVGVGFAAAGAEPYHAGIHAVLALAFGLWAQHLRQRQGGELAVGAGDLSARVEALEGEVESQRRDLAETQERLDFAERLLAQAQETRRVGGEP